MFQMCKLKSKVLNNSYRITIHSKLCLLLLKLREVYSVLARMKTVGTLQRNLNPKVLGQVLSQPKSYPIPPPPYSVLSLSYNRWFSEASNFLLQKVYDCTYARKAEKKKEIFALHLQVRLIDSDKRQKPQLMVVHQWLEHGAVQIRGGTLGGQVPGPLSLPAGEADGRGQVSGGHPRDQAGGDSPHRLRNHPR